MEIPPGKTIVTEVVVRNPLQEVIRGAYAEVDYGGGLTAQSGPVNLAPGASASLQVRLRNPSTSPLAFPSATVILRDVEGRVHSREVRSL